MRMLSHAKYCSACGTADHDRDYGRDYGRDRDRDYDRDRDRDYGRDHGRDRDGEYGLREGFGRGGGRGCAFRRGGGSRRGQSDAQLLVLLPYAAHMHVSWMHAILQSSVML